MDREKWKSSLHEKKTLFYSEFDADSEYVTLFENYFGQKNALIDTCSFNPTKKRYFKRIYGHKREKKEKKRMT